MNNKNSQDYGIKRFNRIKQANVKYFGKLTNDQINEINHFFSNVINYKPWHYHLLEKFLDNNLTHFLDRFNTIRSTTKHTLTYYTSCYGEEQGLIQYNNFKNKAAKNHSNKAEYWIRKGLSKLDANAKAHEIQLDRLSKATSVTRGSEGLYSIRSVKYWMKHGLSKSAANKKVKEIQSTNTLEGYIKKYGKIEGVNNFNERKKQWGADVKREMVDRGEWTDWEQHDYDQFSDYCQIVISLTEINYREYIDYINPLGLIRGIKLYHLDHKISKIDGFVHNIPPNVLSHPCNLEIMWWLDNRKKSSNSSLNLSSLQLLIDNFNTTKKN